MKWCITFAITSVERIFVGRSHVAKVAEARLEQINRYCQVSIKKNHQLYANIRWIQLAKVMRDVELEIINARKYKGFILKNGTVLIKVE